MTSTALPLRATRQALRPPPTPAALAPGVGIEPPTETVDVTLLFAYRRLHDDVVLLRHAPADPQP